MSAATQTQPYDFIEVWGFDNVEDDALPSPETLKQVQRAIDAVEEFLVQPLSRSVQAFAADASNVDKVGFEEIGRLIVWTDEMRMRCGGLLDFLAQIALAAHEDLPQLANGYTADGTHLIDPQFENMLKRFHGLGEVYGSGA